MSEICFYEKKESAFDSALFAMSENQYIPYDGMDLFEEGSKAFHLASHHNQERALIKKDLVESLSKDAYFLIEAINDESDDLKTPKTGNITTRSIKQFLIRSHWANKRINKVLEEVQGFVLQLSKT